MEIKNAEDFYKEFTFLISSYYNLINWLSSYKTELGSFDKTLAKFNSVFAKINGYYKQYKKTAVFQKNTSDIRKLKEYELITNRCSIFLKK